MPFELTPESYREELKVEARAYMREQRLDHDPPEASDLRQLEQMAITLLGFDLPLVARHISGQMLVTVRRLIERDERENTIHDVVDALMAVAWPATVAEMLTAPIVIGQGKTPAATGA